MADLGLRPSTLAAISRIASRSTAVAAAACAWVFPPTAPFSNDEADVFRTFSSKVEAAAAAMRRRSQAWRYRSSARLMRSLVWWLRCTAASLSGLTDVNGSTIATEEVDASGRAISPDDDVAAGEGETLAGGISGAA